MTEIQARPKWVDDLVRALGSDMGLDDLRFEEGGVLELDFQGTEIALFYVSATPSAGEAILVKSALDMPRELPTSLLGQLLVTNLSTFRSGKGMVACDLDFGFWVWTDRIELAGLTAPAFRARVERSANAARDWASIVPNLVAAATKAQTDIPFEPETDDTSILFRL